MRCDVVICLRDFCSRFLLEEVQIVFGPGVVRLCPSFEAAVLVFTRMA